MWGTFCENTATSTKKKDDHRQGMLQQPNCKIRKLWINREHPSENRLNKIQTWNFKLFPLSEYVETPHVPTGLPSWQSLTKAAKINGSTWSFAHRAKSYWRWRSQLWWKSCACMCSGLGTAHWNQLQNFDPLQRSEDTVHRWEYRENSQRFKNADIN